MPEDSSREAGEDPNHFGSKQDWFEIIKWVIIFFVSVIIPLLLLFMLWVIAKPETGVFILLTLVYLIPTIILIKPLVKSD